MLMVMNGTGTRVWGKILGLLGVWLLLRPLGMLGLLGISGCCRIGRLGIVFSLGKFRRRMGSGWLSRSVR